MINQDSCDSHNLTYDASIAKNAKRAALVLWITFATMVLEIYFGYITGSMALLADGWHMATHAAALGITYAAYRFATHPSIVRKFNFGGGKIIALGGFTSALMLLGVVIFIGIEATNRILNPVEINFNEALLVAGIGLAINLICAYILHDTGLHSHNHDHHHHHHDHHEHAPHSHSHDHHFTDHNIRGAYLHVIADALTSIGAIAALLAGKYLNLNTLDPIVGIVGALVIFKWAIGLIKDSGWELLDGHALGVDYQKLKAELEARGGKIQDLHVWKIAPNTLACELIIHTQSPQGLDFYRHILREHYRISHSVIEERK